MFLLFGEAVLPNKVGTVWIINPEFSSASFLLGYDISTGRNVHRTRRKLTRNRRSPKNLDPTPNPSLIHWYGEPQRQIDPFVMQTDYLCVPLYVVDSHRLCSSETSRHCSGGREGSVRAVSRAVSPVLPVDPVRPGDRGKESTACRRP